jgi:hypothetical protein
MNILLTLKPQDSIVMKVKRENKIVELPAVVGSRK